ncbi:MAG: glycosyltransferase family 2 protein [Rikenellaceae bacterium]
MIRPRISIITVVYNAKDELRATLENLKNIRYPDKEIVVIDGNSTDGTKDVIAEYALDITCFVSEPDKGIYDAMNKGLALATGDYVWFINAGDFVYSPDFLINTFQGQELDADIYYGETLVISEDGEPLGLRKKRLPKKLRWQSFRKGMVVCHQSILVKKSIAPKYDLSYRYAADVLWVLESLKRAKNIYNTRQIISKFREGGVSTINRKVSLKERFKIMTQHFGLFQTIISHIVFMFDYFKPKYRKNNLIYRRHVKPNLS